MENILDKILEEQGLNYEDLNAVEKETYNKANFSLQKITVEDVKEYVKSMKDSIALQLTDIPEDEVEKKLILKARLKNYILLEAFLIRPEKAEKAIRNQLGQAKKN